MKDMPLVQRDMLKNRIVRHIKNYEIIASGGSVEQSKKEEKMPQKGAEGSESEDFEEDDFDMEELKNQLPLPEGVLKSNLGIPIIIACHKVDLISRGERAQFLEQNIDFIQRHLREFCIYYGAALIFTEIHQDQNLEVLYKYILHRIYDQEFTEKA